MQFNEGDNNLIRIYMGYYGECTDCFKIISYLIPSFPEFTPEQISHQWKNYLDPCLCHEPLKKDEKKFVINWFRKHRTSNIINWKIIIDELEKIFGNRHAEIKVKDFLNSAFVPETEKPTND